MTENGNIIITRTITTANPREYFINGIHLKTVAGMLKIFELVTECIFLFKFKFKINDDVNICFSFLDFRYHCNLRDCSLHS